MPEIASSLRTNGPPLIVAAVAGVLVAAASALWVYYGSTVFFEIVVAGLQACF
jgi:type III secretory pathway component EscS